MSTSAPLQLQQQQVLLRLPEDLAARVHTLVREGQQPSKSKQPTIFDVKPQDAQAASDDFIFTVDGKEYPALLLNLPTPLESHKTFDNKIFLKSSDIGQMLQVFNSTKERDLASAKVVKTLSGDYCPSGVTPPTHDVVRRRFELARKSGENHLPYKVRQVCEEISRGVDNPIVSSGSSEPVGRGRAAGGRAAVPDVDDVQSEVVLETVCEEVVDFQEWMADPLRPGHGVSISITGSDWSSEDAQFLQRHPEVLLSQVDAEEDAIEQLAVEQLRTERVRAADQLEVGGASLQDVATEQNACKEVVQAEAPSSLRLSLKLSLTDSTAAVAATVPTVEPTANDGEEAEMIVDLAEDEGSVDESDKEEPGEEEEEEEDIDDEEVFAAVLSLQRTSRTALEPAPVSTNATPSVDVVDTNVSSATPALMMDVVEEVEENEQNEEVAVSDEDDDEDWMNKV